MWSKISDILTFPFGPKTKATAKRGSITAMSIALDHNYCLLVPSGDDSKTEISSYVSPMKPQNKREEAICPRVDSDREISPIGEAIDLEILSSSSSPAHSSDSGLDVGIEDFLTDFASSWGCGDFGLNEYDFKDLEELLKSNEQSIKLSCTKPGLTNLSVRGNCGKRQQISQEKVEDEQAIVEKNRKNAIAAKENREKKKKYIEGLEKTVSDLIEENKTLKAKNESLTAVTKKLAEEVKYLRNVLANETTISLLLKSVAATPGISLSSSLVQSTQSQGAEKESDAKEEERKYVTRSRKRRPDERVGDAPSKRSRSNCSGGVCLHVSGGKVSLELCSNCEKKAMQGGVL